jgi:DNA polymerase-3 subunit gamma/tau
LTSLAKKENLSVEPEVISMIGRHAQGSLRDAESLLDQLVAAPGDTITLDRAQKVLGTASDSAIIELTESWLSAEGNRGLKVIHEALNQGADARQFTRQMVEHLRKLLLLRTAGPDISLDITSDQKQILVRQAQSTARSSLIQALKVFHEAATVTSSAWQPQLPLEMAFIQLLPETEDRTLSPPQAESSKVVDAANNSSNLNETADSHEIEEEISPKIDQEKHQNEDMQSNRDASLTQRTFKIEQIVRSWQDLRSFVDERDRNLKALLASCKPIAAEGKTLILGFDFPILKDKFDAKPHNSEIISDGLKQLLGASFIVKTVISKQYAPQIPPVDVNEDEFAALAEELGAKISDYESENPD